MVALGVEVLWHERRRRHVGSYEYDSTWSPRVKGVVIGMFVSSDARSMSRAGLNWCAVF